MIATILIYNAWVYGIVCYKLEHIAYFIGGPTD
jgi:hypothetical protein